MTTATITLIDVATMDVSFAYNVRLKDAVKALPGSTFDGSSWQVAIMHLPTVAGIFAAVDVAPDVIAAYHALLRQMLSDIAGSEHREGVLGKHLAELRKKHANGIAAVLANGWQPEARRVVEPVQASLPIVEDGAHGRDADLAQWLRALQNAVKREEKLDQMRKRTRRNVSVADR